MEESKMKFIFQLLITITTMLMTYREIYEKKNIMVILIAGDESNKYYLKVNSVIEKIKAQ